MAFYSTDETYLEAIVDHLQTLPHKIRRNMDLVKTLDYAAVTIKLPQMRLLQEQYIARAEDKVIDYSNNINSNNNRIKVIKNNDNNDTEVDDDDENDKPKSKKQRTTEATSNQPRIPKTAEMMRIINNSNDNESKDMDELYYEYKALAQQYLQMADEKVVVSRQTYGLVDAAVQRLDQDLKSIEQLLQASGSFHVGTAAKPNDLAACQVVPGSEWILAKVIHHDLQSGMYRLSDEDIESNKIFNLPTAQVIVLQLADKLRAGDVVYAVYPDTTSFYQATVVQAPRKQAGTNAPSASAFCMVNFVDDSDEFGVTHDKAVPLKHVMMPPSS